MQAKQVKIYTLAGVANQAEEIWKIVRFEGLTLRKKYFISNYGNFKSVSKKNNPNVTLLKTKTIKGYQAINLRSGSLNYTFFIHKLVAEAFCKKKNSAAKFILHLDYNKNNNDASNLRWATQKEAVKHQSNNPYVINQTKRNILSSGKRAKVLNKKTVEKLKEELFDKKRNKKYADIAKKYGISEMTLYRIKRGEIWYTVKVKNEPKSENYKQFKKVKKEKKRLKKLLKT